MRQLLDRDHLLHLLRKAAGPVALVALVLLGSLRLFSSLHLTAPSLRSIARPSNAASSTSAMFAFDLPHTHLNPSERILSAATVSHLVPAWISHPGDVIYSSPAIANGVVYIGSDDGKLYALDASTGSIQWTKRTGNFITSSPAVAAGVVYVSSWDGQLYAFDARTGGRRWSAPTGHKIDSSPTVANGLVYLYSSDGQLYAFDAKTGSTRWRYFIGGVSNASYLIDSSPAVMHGMVYIGSRDHKVFAFHLMAGAL